MTTKSTSLKPKLSDIKNKSKVVIEYVDDRLDFEAEFTCMLPNQRTLKDALDSSSKTKRGNQQVDQLAFAKKLFVPCVIGWSFEDECTTEARLEFVGDDAVLNKMALHVSLQLMDMAQARIDAERGN